jgi:hypothetical protein
MDAPDILYYPVFEVGDAVRPGRVPVYTPPKRIIQ